MSSVIDDHNIKVKCQRFTPPDAVAEMLGMASYSSKNSIVGKKVLENSFGSGNIIIAIVQEYVKACREIGLSPKDISRSLGSSIYGIELDKELFKDTLKRLDNYTDICGLPRVQWNLFNCDALFWKNKVKFDYIIGNPPYVSYSDIEKDIRNKVRNKYQSCSLGKFDYCYAFIESAINMLSSSGKLVQLIPNNVYKNVYAEQLRTKLRDHISMINIYPSQKLFKDVLTSTSIFLYDTNCNGDLVRCINKTENTTFYIRREKLRGKWVLSDKEDTIGNARFGDFFKVSSSVATLLNDAFIINKEQAGGLEAEALRKAVSPKSLHLCRDEYIIFPYDYTEDGKLKRLSENECQSRFPKAMEHLYGYRERLDDRASDRNAKWYEYGRSQALKHINQEKLVLSTVITTSISIYKVSSETVPYAGLYIVPVSNEVDLSDAEAILKSEDFLDYIRRIGINVNGNSIRITCNDINNYVFYKDEIDGRA